MPDQIRYAGFPDAVVYAKPDGKSAVQHLIFGDWLSVKSQSKNGFRKVRARGVDGWVRTSDFQKERPLEITFVDIGQGDGAHMVTPDDKHFLVDAGLRDNMYRYLRWRFNGFQKPFRFEGAVISHPDSDHYGGFESIFAEPNLSFGTLYHNGLVERKAKDVLGKRKKVGRRTYVTDIIQSKAQLSTLLSRAKNWQGKKYPTMLKTGLDGNKFKAFTALSAQDGHVPGFGPSKELQLEVLGPVLEPDSSGNPRLRWLSSLGKTKNGHSVVLRLVYRNVSVLLGGDLNIPSEELLMEHHTGLSARPRNRDERYRLIEAARRVFQVDIAKSCHHGSGDFSSDFLSALNPVATVISSGDDEPHSHPRADTLGAIGVNSRGARPLIFSTELARSAKEAIKHPNVLREQIIELTRQIKAASGAKQARLVRKQEKLVQKIDRSIAVYGAINVRTDGNRVVIAQKLERPRSKKKKWDIYTLEQSGHQGPLVYRSPH